MENAPLSEAWRVLSESVFAEMESWRKEHPTATFKEIEDELDVRLSGMRAQMVADLAHQSQKREWSGQEPEQRPRCSQCGSPLQAREKRAPAGNTGRKRGEAGTQLWDLPAVWKRVFPPGS